MNSTRRNARRLALVSATLLFGFPAPASAAPTLFDWVIMRDSSSYASEGALPASVNGAGFDFETGLGTISATFDTPGDHYFSLFVDHEIDEAVNTFFNEYGRSFNAPAVGQTWEIDEPGFVFGDIYENVLAQTLDSLNSVPQSAPDDVSMALGWNFSLAAEETATITMEVTSGSRPAAGFFLAHTDPDSAYTLYFSSRLAYSTTPIPDPTRSLYSLAMALTCLAVLRRKC